jgi:hypothetical protein
VMDSSGPVKPRITPILMSSAKAPEPITATMAVAESSLFMCSLPSWITVLRRA